MRLIWGALALLLLALPAGAEVRLQVSPVLQESGVLKHMLPRFSLKTSVRVALVPDNADVRLAESGDLPVMQAVTQGGGQMFYLTVLRETPSVLRLASWLQSDVGQRTIGAFKRDGRAVFNGAAGLLAQKKEAPPSGDVVAGEKLSYKLCGRCHVIGDRNRMNGVGSTPSFALMRTFPDWRRRYEAFFILRPHPSFTQIKGMTEPFPLSAPPVISPLRMNVEDLRALVAFVATIEPADLGAPLAHQ